MSSNPFTSLCRLITKSPIKAFGTFQLNRGFLMNQSYNTALIIGGSRGTGRALAIKLSESGTHTIVVGRTLQDLEQLKNEYSNIEILALDATADNVASELLTRHEPDLLVLVGGVQPKMDSIKQLNWNEFSAPWNTDVKIAFEFTQAALRLPMKKGAHIVSFSSGASLFGSPLSGGYAGSKRMQHFLVNYGQRESDIAQLGLRFTSVIPKQLMQDTDIAKQASTAYAKAAGKTPKQFMAQWDKPLTADFAGSLVFDLITAKSDPEIKTYILTGQGAEAMS